MQILDLEDKENKIETINKIGKIKLNKEKRKHKNKLQRIKIECEHKNKMQDEEFNHLREMKKIENSIESMKLNDEFEIEKNSSQTEFVLQEIKYEIEKNHLKNELDYQTKLQHQKFVEKDELLKQEKEKEEMDNKLKELMCELSKL